MKNKKLSLEKFKIAKLNNQASIFGGNIDDDGGLTKTKPKCIENSTKWVK
jgi:hypothetical protein